MSHIWIALSLACLMYQAEANLYLIKARPFSTVQLPCELGFIKGTDQLHFTWSIDKLENFFFYYAAYRKQWVYENYGEFETMFSFRNNEVVQEGDSYKYEGRITLNHTEFGDGILTLLLENVSYADRGMYRCKAKSLHGMAEQEMILLLEDEEEPPVQLEKVGKEFTVKCISTGWYKNPIVRWFNGINKVTNKAMKKTLAVRPDGTHRIVSTLHVPGFDHGTYRCLIGDAERIQRQQDLDRRLSALFQNPEASLDKFYPTVLD